VSDSRTLRADARRNRARILEVAEAVFAAQGLSASTEAIAREARVGIGTVFRHFPTKEALLEAVFAEHLRRLADDARGLSEADDAGAALVAFLARVVDRSATKNALAAALGDAGVDVSGPVKAVRRELRDAIGKLLHRAQDDGSVRADVSVAEVLALLLGATLAAQELGPRAASRRRIVQVIADGLRPQAGPVP
jgi:AcrR family transcriptional regulator